MRHLYKLFVATLFVLIIVSFRPVYAETFEELMSDLEGPRQQYNTMVSPAYLRTNITEDYINPQSGELVLSQADYVLPGRNGLDLEIKRLYKSGAATWYRCGVKYKNGAYVDYLDNIADTGNSYANTFYELRYNLGCGMRFSFPTIELSGNYKFLHTESGDVYRMVGPSNGVYTLEGHTVKDIEIKNDTSFTSIGTNRYGSQYTMTSQYVMIEKSGKKTYFDNQGRILGIVDRYNNRIRFEYIDFRYNLSEGVITKVLISKIIDSVGREVTIEYKEDPTFTVTGYDPNTNTADGNLQYKFQVIISLPNSKKIVYDKSCMIFRIDTLHVVRTRVQRIYDVDVTLPVDDNSPIKYWLGYEQPKFGFTFFNGTTYNPALNNTYENIETVENYKTGKDVLYTYGMFTKGLNERNGSMQYRKVVQKEDTDWGAVKNQETYAYTNEPDGFGYPGYNANDQNYLKNTYCYYTEKTDMRGVKIKYTYNGLAETINVEDWGNDHKEVSTITNDANKLPAKKEKLAYNVVNGQVSGTPVKLIENYIYDQYGNLTSFTGPSAARDTGGNPANTEYTVTYTYATDRFHILTSKTWKKDASTTCKSEYDVASNGNVTQERRIHTGNNIIVDYLYDSYGNMTRKTLHYANSSGNTYTTNYEYGIDADGVDHKGAYLTKEYSTVDGVEISKKYIYDFSTGNLKANKDERDQRTDYQYDVFNRVTKITYPDTTTKQYQYYDYCNDVIYTDQNGKQFYYVFDIFGNLTNYYRAGASAGSWNTVFICEYDSNNNKIKEKDALGHSTRYEYDSANRLRKKSFWENDTTEKKAMTVSYTVGPDSGTALLCTITDEEGYTNKYRYDIENRLIKEEATPDKSIYYTTTYAYDYIGNKTDVIDARNYTTKYIYDDLGRITSKKDMAPGYETTFSYDAAGKLIEEKNPRNISTYYDYDLLGRLIRKRAPAAGGGTAVTRYVYDNAGNKVKEITPNNYDAAKDTPALVNTMAGISYTYNNMNRVESVLSPEGSLIECRKYDGNGNLKKAVDGLRYTGNIDTSPGTTYSYDYADRVTQVNNALNQNKSYMYDSRGKLTSMTDGRGKITTYNYYSDGTLWKVTYPDTGVIEYKYDKLGFLTEKKDPLGKKTYYEYNGFGKLYKERDEYGGEAVYGYDGNGNIASVKDNRGSITEFTYDALNRLDVKKVPLERDAYGNILYAIVDYNYDGAGNIVKKDITGTKDTSSHRITNYTYYNNNLVDTITDNSGASIKNFYDKNGNLVRTETLRSTGAYGISKFEYDNRDRLLKSIKLIDETDIHNAVGLANITNLRDPDYSGKMRIITGYEYDILGNRTKTIDPRAYGFIETDTANRDNYTTRYEYDILNRLEKTKWEYTGTDVYRQYYYDANSNKIQERSERGTDTYYTYDNSNRLKTIAKPIDYAAGRKTVTYNYDLAGNKTSEVNAKGDTITYTYDRLNRLETMSDAYNRVISANIYDENGNITKAIDAKGYLSGSDNNARYGTKYEYDLANRLVKVIDPEIAALNDPGKYTMKYEYNQYSQKTRETDALGHEKEYEFDNAGRLTKVIDALDVPVNYSYDKAGNMLSMTDGRGKVTSYGYGASGILRTTTNAEGKSMTYQYDIALNCARLVDRNGNETFYTYDNRNLLLSKDVPQTGDGINYSYDAIGNRIQMIDGTGMLGYSYDSDDRLTSITKSGAAQISYTYDIAGNISTVTDKKGFVTTYTYDKNSRMSTASYIVAGANKTTTYSYDYNGNRQSLAYQGGVKEEYTYDRNNRLLTLTNKKPDNSIISSYSYTYDLAGRQETKIDSYGATIYTYDNAGRIKQVEAPGKTTVYGYDNAGNRISLNENYTSDQSSGYIDEGTGSEIKYRIKSSEYVYSDTNKLLKLAESMKDISGVEVLQKWTVYYYDENGNQVGQGSSYIKPYNPSLQETFFATAYEEEEVTFDNIINGVRNTYDGFDRLKKVETIKAGARTIAEFDYNGDDLRVKKTVKKSSNNYAPEMTSYLYDRQYVILETDSTDNVKARYIRGINYIARVDASNKLSYFLYNGHGDVVQTVNEAGTVENQYDYDIFGNETLAIEVSYSCEIRYAGEFYDGEMGLYYLRARYYNPYAGRFISEDTYKGNIFDPLSLNYYTYCSNNPIKYTDPTGHWQKGDENLTQKAQKDIIGATNDYYEAEARGDKAGMEDAHNKAEGIRNDPSNLAKNNKGKDKGGKSQNQSLFNVLADTVLSNGYFNKDTWSAISAFHPMSRKASNDIESTAISTYIPLLVYGREPSLAMFNKVGQGMGNPNYSFDQLTDDLAVLTYKHLSWAHRVNAIWTPEHSSTIIKDYDEQITKVSKELDVPKEMIQAVLYRELTCYGLDDIAADAAVIAGLISDSSTGLGQIFAQTAIRAEKTFNPNSKIDINDKDDLKTMWNKLQDDNTNIYYVGLVLKMEAKYQDINDIYKATDEQIKNIIAGYNGGGALYKSNEAQLYGTQTKQYYDLYKKYNNK